MGKIRGDSPKGWKRLGGDVNWEQYNGSWYKKDHRQKRAFYVLRFQNMENTPHKDLPQYECCAAYVDLNDISPKNITSALDCCGWEKDGEGAILNSYDKEEIAEPGFRADLLILEAFVMSFGVEWGDYETSCTYPARLRAMVARQAVR